MKLDKEQRKGLAKALYDIGKLVFAVVVLGPLVSPEKFKLTLFIFGFIVFLCIFVFAAILNKGE